MDLHYIYMIWCSNEKYQYGVTNYREESKNSLLTKGICYEVRKTRYESIFEKNNCSL